MFCHRGQIVVDVIVMNMGVEVPENEMVFQPPLPGVRSEEQTCGLGELMARLLF